MFTTEHFIWMGISIVFIAVMMFFGVKKKYSLKCAGYIMTVICILSETCKMMSEMIEGSKGGMVLDPRALPFHLCSLMIFGILYITFGREGKLKQTLIDFIAVAGVLGSICAILIPTNGTDFASIFSYQCFVYHAGLLWFAIYLIASGNAHLGLKTFGRNMVVLIALVLAMLYVNSVLSVYGTNFMYLVRPPMKNLPILNLDRGWYVYFLSLMGVGVALISLFHLPFIIGELKSRKGNKK
ncbi:MAG: TIGR02206 family membrane protein [Ruminococcaceae bacterium]|nr:TIGR02206 family membrane protein [Oscillospiraceae bacterium]